MRTYPKNAVKFDCAIALALATANRMVIHFRHDRVPIFCGFMLLLAANSACAQAPIVCGVVQTNIISVIGERDTYTYAAAVGEVVTIRMSALTTGLDPLLELRDAGSNLIASAASRIDRTLTNGGTYLIIALDQGNNETGDYALVLQRLVNPCNAAPLACGATVSASLDGAGEVDAWSFTASAGDVMTFRLNVTNSLTQFSPRLELFDPQGRTVSASGTTFTGTLTNAGGYTLLVSYNSGTSRTGDYWLTVEKLNTSCDATTLNCPDLLTNSMSAIEEIDAYTIPVPPGGAYTTLRLESLTASFTATMELFDPLGRAVGSALSTLTSNLTNTGNYTLLVSHSSGTSRTGDYRLALQRIVNPCAATVVPCGAVAAGALGVVGELDAFTINSTGGEVFLLQLLSTNALFPAQFDLYSPAGTVLTTSDTDFIGTFTNAGTYTVIVRSSTGTMRTGNYWLSVERTANPCEATPLACGAVVTNSISTIRETDSYTIVGDAFVLLRLESATANFTPIMRLYNPAGALVTSSTGTIQSNLAAGTYTLLVSHSSGSSRTGDYRLAQQRIVNPCNAMPLACGDLLAAGITVAGEYDAYTLTAVGGEVAVLSLISQTTGFNVTMDIFDPTGRALTSSFGVTRFAGVLTNAGLYTIFVHYGSGASHTGAYSLYSQNLATPCGSLGAIACGGLVSGLVPSAGFVTHSFAGTAGDVIVLRLSTTSTPTPAWEVYEPDGTLLVPSSTSFKRSLTKTGNYVVLVFSPSGTPQIADYVLSLNTVRQPCAAVPLACGAVQAGAITENGEVHAYTFMAASNEVVGLRVGSATEFFDVVFDLYDPDGSLVTGSLGYHDLTPLLSNTGQYTALVHWPDGADSRLGEYRLSFYRVSAPCSSTPVSLGQTVNATLDEATQTHLYNFMAGPGPVTVCLRDSSPALIASMELYTAAGELLVPPTSFQIQPTLSSNGTYRLLVHDAGTATGDYALRFNNGAVTCSDFDLTAPSVFVFTPGAGECVTRGMTYSVTWNVFDSGTIARQELWLSQDGGRTFTALATNLAANVRNYDWSVPAGASAAEWRLRVTAYDALGQSGIDETEGTFFAVNTSEVRGALYAYDVLNQLVFASDSAGQAQLYAYDPALNRIQLFAIADPNADSDSDGLPDFWEVTHSFDPTSPADGAADNDGDGMSNYQEYFACTDPFSFFSALRIAYFSFDGTDSYLYFTSHIGRTYSVEWTDNLVSGTWIQLPPLTATSDFTTVTHIGGGSAQRRFYRLRVEPGPPCDMLP
jgi:hypothetical protein